MVRKERSKKTISNYAHKRAYQKTMRQFEKKTLKTGRNLKRTVVKKGQAQAIGVARVKCCRKRKYRKREKTNNHMDAAGPAPPALPPPPKP